MPYVTSFKPKISSTDAQNLLEKIKTAGCTACTPDWFDGNRNIRFLKSITTYDVDDQNIAKLQIVSAFALFIKKDQYKWNVDYHPDRISKSAGFLTDFDPFFDGRFPPHLTPTEIRDGIQRGELRQGSYAASRENCLEGFVNVEGMSILLQGHAGLNRAVDGDIVAVELFKENDWKAPSEIILQDDQEKDPHDVHYRVYVPESEETTEKKQPTGKVVGIIRRKWRQYCGILKVHPILGFTQHKFVPAEKKIPKVYIDIKTQQSEELKDRLIVIEIDEWPEDSRYPIGHFVRALGALGNKDTENEVLLLEHDVPHCKFSKEVLSCLPTEPWTITHEDREKRLDLSDKTICSVHPPVQYIHLAVPISVMHFTVDSCQMATMMLVFILPTLVILFGQAMHSTKKLLPATTVYLVDKRIDMVPELLSSNLCSLRGGEERFAFSCVWEIDEHANIINTKYHKSIIKSKKAMTYEDAQLIIDDEQQNDDIAKSLRNLNELAKVLKERRIEKGALVLASPEIRFQFDSETQDPIEVEVKKIRETNSMVEEFMLLANISVAEKIESEFPEFAMLRRHPEPPQTNFDPLIKAGKRHGFDIDTTSGKKLAESLDEAVRKDNPYFNTMLRILATRCMRQTVCFISGTVQKEEYLTDFTSPIRRYADIIVHRLLASCIGADSKYSLDEQKSANLCNNLKYRNRMAQYASRASVSLNTHLFFRGRTQEEKGFILLVRKNALQILIPKFDLEGTIYLSGEKSAAHKSGIQFVFDEEDHTQHYKNIVFRAFDPVTIRLSLDATNVQREIVFELVKPFIAGFSVEPMETDTGDEQLPIKRKANESTTTSEPKAGPSKTLEKKNKKSKK